jgi:hypothetical protein
VWAAIPFTLGETPLAYLLLQAGHKKAHKAQKSWEANYEHDSETIPQSHFVPFVPFCDL